jgi:hypothetical protein
MVKKFSLFSLLSLSLIGCAFFGIEDFPSYLPYVREVIDINGLLSNKNVANYTLVAGKFIKLGNKQYIAAHVASQQNPGDILGIILSEQNNPSNSMWISRDVFTLSGGIISRYLFPSVKNYLASGNREFNPFSASITTNLSFYIGANDLKNFNYLFPNGSFNYVFQIYFNGSSKYLLLILSNLTKRSLPLVVKVVRILYHLSNFLDLLMILSISISSDGVTIL